MCPVSECRHRKDVGARTNFVLVPKQLRAQGLYSVVAWITGLVAERSFCCGMWLEPTRWFAFHMTAVPKEMRSGI